MLALGAASAALDALKSLTSSKSSSAQSSPFSQKPPEPFNIFSGTAMSGDSKPASGLDGLFQISPATMSALLAAQSQSTTGSTPSAASTGKADVLKDLFSQLDANSDGQVSKSEFENALGAGGTNIANADKVQSKLDEDGNGTVSLDEMLSALTGSGKRHHPADANSKALQGASSTSVVNSDGSTTTSLSYADGSKVTMTSPSAAAAASAASSSYNYIEQMIARETKAFAASSGAWMNA